MIIGSGREQVEKGSRIQELERKLAKAEQQLRRVRASSTMARFLLNQSSAIVLQIDHEGWILEASREAGQLLGIALASKRFNDVIRLRTPGGLPLSASLVLSLVRQEGSSVTPLEMTLKVYAGPSRHVLVRLAPVWRGNTLSGAILAITDITHLKNAETKLRESERMYRSLAESMPQLVFFASATEGNLYVNQNWRDYCGPHAEWANFRWTERIHPAERPAVLQRMGECLQSGQVFEAEYRFQRADGEYRWHLTRAVPVRDDDGIICHWVGSLTDIHEANEAAARLRESEARFRTVVENSRDGINMLDLATGRYVFLSPAQVAMTGFSEQELLNLSLQESLARVHPDDRHRLFEYIRETSEGSGNAESPVEYRWQVKSGEYRWFSDGRRLLRDDDGRPVALVGVSRDVTDRKLTELRLQENEQRLRLATQSARFGVYDMDLDQGSVYWSPEMREILGVSPEKAPPPIYSVPDFLHPEDAPRFRELIARVFDPAGDGALLDQHRVVLPDGTVRWVQLRGQVLFAGEGASRRAVRNSGVVFDITERKEIEEALAASEQQFRGLANAIPQLSWMADANGWIFWYNQRWYDFTGTTLAEMEGWGWQAVHHPDHLGRVVERIKRSYQTGEPWEDLFPLRARDGSFRWFLSRALPLRSADGAIVRWFGTNTDVTERFEAEARFRALTHTVPEILYIADPNGQSEFVSPQFCQFTGISEAESRGTGWAQALHPDDHRPTMDAWMRAVEAGEPFSIENRLRRHDGVYHWFIGRAVPIRNQDGRITKWFGAHTDVDELKRLEYALQKSTQELKQSNEDLQQFAFLVSHDLQAPLRTIHSMSEILALRCKELLDPEGHQILLHLQSAVQRMDLLIRDLLDYSRLAANSATMRRVETAPLLQTALTNLEAQIAETDATISVEPLPAVMGNDQLARVFQNLIENALKYRSRERPVIAISVSAEEDRWIFSVKDNGIGFEMKYADRIFQLFERLHTQRHYQGNGVGLASCRLILERLGGKIWAHSAPGAGSTFSFSLLKADSAAAAALD